LRKQGIKFEALGYDMSLVATRLKGVGRALSADIEDMAHQAHWGAAIRARSRGRVGMFLGRPHVALTLSSSDMQLVRRGVSVLGQMMLAAGADYVEPGVHGCPQRISDRAEMERFETTGPTDPKSYMMAVTHMFGSCAMGSDPDRSVVRPDFRHHRIECLYVADSSVFPTNIGVNPQTSIIALATVCGRRVIEASL
jgi:choline dehydrogenase-like flavoprotein